MNGQVDQETVVQRIVEQGTVDHLHLVLLVHVPEIVHHVPEIEQNNAQVVAAAMIAQAQHVTFQMVVP
jgi:hypothetical protein